MHKKQKRLALLLLVFFGALSYVRYMQKRKEAVVTIYVHGTLGLRTLFSYLPKARELTYVPDGLHHVDDLDEGSVSQSIADIFSEGDATRFNRKHFYAFGWSGDLCFKKRKLAAEKLSQSIQDILIDYNNKYWLTPKIQVVTFSHGGNVALNMAHYLSEKINIELILIAPPIQKETEDLVVSSCFSKIYMIASQNDLIQVCDPQNMYKDVAADESTKMFSRRFIEHDCDNLKQVCISVNGTYLGHLELFQLFNQHIPTVLKRLDQSLDIKGKTIGYFDIDDKDFPFFYGPNFLDVIQGRRS